VEHDLHRFADLARRVTPVGTLGGGGAGEARSPRLHEILAEQGFSRELRLALRTGSTLWGAVVLLREHGRRPFSDEEARAALAIAQPLTRAVKRISVRPRGQVPPPLPPGVVIVGPDDTAEAISPQAAAWFSDFRPYSEDPLPYVVVQAAAGTRNEHGAPTDQLARIRTWSGRWLSLAACPLGGGRVAVVLQPATTDQLLPAIAAWYEFTPDSSTWCTFSCKLTPSSRSHGAFNYPPTPSRITSRPSTARPGPTASKNSWPHFAKYTHSKNSGLRTNRMKATAPTPRHLRPEPSAPKRPPGTRVGGQADISMLAEKLLVVTHAADTRCRCRSTRRLRRS
jgi:hypothetical protein